jgi:hypothetical protein
MSSIGVVLDACVLFPGSLRDILLRATEADLYRLCLTDQILEEMRRNLVKKEHTSSSKNPPLSLQEVLGRLKKVVPTFTQAIQGRV